MKKNQYPANYLRRYKENTALLFDGGAYHASNNMRKTRIVFVMRVGNIGEHTVNLFGFSDALTFGCRCKAFKNNTRMKAWIDDEEEHTKGSREKFCTL